MIKRCFSKCKFITSYYYVIATILIVIFRFCKTKDSLRYIYSKAKFFVKVDFVRLNWFKHKNFVNDTQKILWTLKSIEINIVKWSKIYATPFQGQILHSSPLHLLTLQCRYFCWNFKSRESSITRFYFSQATWLITVELDSLCSRKSTILTFVANTFLSLTNDKISTGMTQVLILYQNAG